MIVVMTTVQNANQQVIKPSEFKNTGSLLIGNGFFRIPANDCYFGSPACVCDTTAF